MAILNKMDILIFKTNVITQADLRKIDSLLNSIPFIFTWNVDREDIDRVLRIECEGLKAEQIAGTLIKAGFECCELAD